MQTKGKKKKAEEEERKEGNGEREKVQREGEREEGNSGAGFGMKPLRCDPGSGWLHLGLGERMRSHLVLTGSASSGTCQWEECGQEPVSPQGMPQGKFLREKGPAMSLRDQASPAGAAEHERVQEIRPRRPKKSTRVRWASCLVSPEHTQHSLLTSRGRAFPLPPQQPWRWQWAGLGGSEIFHLVPLYVT